MGRLGNIWRPGGVQGVSGVVRGCCACLVVSVNDVLGVTIESGAFTGGAVNAAKKLAGGFKSS